MALPRVLARALPARLGSRPTTRSPRPLVSNPTQRELSWLWPWPDDERPKKQRDQLPRNIRTNNPKEKAKNSAEDANESAKTTTERPKRTAGYTEKTMTALVSEQDDALLPLRFYHSVAHCTSLDKRTRDWALGSLERAKALLNNGSSRENTYRNVVAPRQLINLATSPRTPREIHNEAWLLLRQMKACPRLQAELLAEQEMRAAQKDYDFVFGQVEEVEARLAKEAMERKEKLETETETETHFRTLDEAMKRMTWNPFLGR